MIDISAVRILYSYMAKILYYGVKNRYADSFIEERIASSSMFKSLEDSDDSFIYKEGISSLIKEIYLAEEIDERDIYEVTSLFDWLGEAYIRLFFRFHKSMSYIFIYIPLDDMIQRYHLYHEMDWTALYSLFDELTRKDTLLKKLLQKRGFSLKRLSQLTDISFNTLKYYYTSDEHLYEAKYAYLDTISFILRVNINIFLKNIHNYTNSELYSSDEGSLKYRSYLGLYLASFFSLDIEKRSYVYDEKRNCFSDKNGSLMVYEEDENHLLEDIVNNVSNKVGEKRSHTVIVVFVKDVLGESIKPFSHLHKYGFEKICIIGLDSFIQIGKSSNASYLSTSVYNAFVEKAKKKTNYR